MLTVKGSIYRLDLELSLYNKPHSRVTSFNPDLRVLIVDVQVFSITKGLDNLTATLFTIQNLSELLIYYRTRLNSSYRVDLYCLISLYNSCFIFISLGDLSTREAALSTIYAFRVNLVSRLSVRLSLDLLKDLIFILAEFHPSQQLMLLIYTSFSRSDSQPFKEAPPPHVVIVELGSLEMKPIVLPKSRSFITRIKE